ncbi:MAG: sulfatase-like hydrolase/transferase, partial [Blastocatellia bacterium]
PAKFKTRVEALGDHGYFTGLTAQGWGPGVANDANGKPREMAGKPFNQRKLKPMTTGIGANDYAANFADFLDAAPAGQPWSFWYGAVEPHREYEYGSGVKKGGRKLSDIERVPGFWPDNEIIRNDMLDYALEIEHFDTQLGRMLEALEKRGLLDNTIVVVTSDHGMPFPRGKAQAYDTSNHVPLAIMWKGGMKAAGRTIADYVSFADFAPTFLELAGVKPAASGMQPTVGRALTDILYSAKNDRVNPARDHVLIGKERHDVSRPNDVGYPIRGIHKNGMLYLRNYEPDRWPAGNPETGYLDCDAGATKTELLSARREGRERKHWEFAFGKRPAEELYDVAIDPDCLRNIADHPGYQARMKQLRAQMERELKAQGDPRMSGRGRIFDQYLYSDEKNRDFYNRYMRGEKVRAGWVLESDFEKQPVR